MSLSPRSRFSEDKIQAVLVNWLKNRSIGFQVGLEGAKRGKIEQARMKRLGMMPGHPDITLFLQGAKTVFIELKTESGKVSPLQKQRHEDLKRWGFDVYVVYCRDEWDAVKQMERIVKKYMEIN